MTEDYDAETYYLSYLFIQVLSDIRQAVDKYKIKMKL